MSTDGGVSRRQVEQIGMTTGKKKRSPDNSVIARLFDYDNYRFFLRDYFREQKRLSSAFSHRYFARKAGFSSSSFCAHVIEGKRNLTLNSLRKMVRGLGLSGKPESYFTTLVLYNQADTVEDREHYYPQLERLRKSTRFYRIQGKQHAYYDEWYYPVIRELAVYADWHGDYAVLGNLVRPPLPPERCRKAVETLIEIGLLRRNADGTYTQLSSAVTAEGVPAVVTRKSRKEFILRAIEAMEDLPVDERHISGVTAAMSEKRYKEIMDQIDALRREILTAATGDSTVDGVYQFNFQLFPVSNRIDRRHGRRKPQ